MVKPWSYCKMVPPYCLLLLLHFSFPVYDHFMSHPLTVLYLFFFSLDNSTAPIARPDAYSGVSTVKTGPAGSDTVRLQAHRIRLPCYFVAASVLLWKFGFTS